MKKVVLVTGASSGIGKAIATYLHAKGHRVYGTSRNPEKYRLAYPLLSLELTDKKSILQVIQNLLQKEGRIDVLVNNAGIGITGPLEETPSEEMRKAFDVIFFGAVELMKAVIPPMRKQGDGQIINISSIAGYMGLPYRSVYSAAKAALEMLSEAARMEVLPFNIKVSSIAPGDYATNIAAGRYHAPVRKDSPYYENYKMNLELMNAHVDQGSDPAEIGKLVYKIISCKDPKIRYRSGKFLQRFAVHLKRLLPDRLYEKLMLHYYGLRKNKVDQS